MVLEKSTCLCQISCSLEEESRVSWDLTPLLGKFLFSMLASMLPPAWKAAVQLLGVSNRTRSAFHVLWWCLLPCVFLLTVLILCWRGAKLELTRMTNCCCRINTPCRGHRIGLRWSYMTTIQWLSVYWCQQAKQDLCLWKHFHGYNPWTQPQTLRMRGKIIHRS